MSVATLKKKTRTQYHNMSVNRVGGFSLNGTRRSQGYVGQDMLGRHLQSTPMRGNVARGSGGCCGTHAGYSWASGGICLALPVRWLCCITPSRCRANGHLTNMAATSVGCHRLTPQTSRFAGFVCRYALGGSVTAADFMIVWALSARKRS